MIGKALSISTAATLAAALAPLAGAQVLVHDEFDQASLDLTTWKQPDPGPGSFLGRTQLRTGTAVLPQLVNGAVQLTLDTWGGGVFVGTEIMTIERYDLLDGLAFETSSRLVNPPPGLIGSLFTFDFDSNTGLRDEIDVELLSNDVVNNNDRVLTNVFDDDGFNVGGDGAFANIPGIDLQQFNTYRVEWRPDRLDWFVNGNLVRTEFDTVPDSPTNVRLNFWAPASDFPSAFSAALQPAASPFDNERYIYEADYVLIERLGALPTDPDSLLINGSFENGLNSWAGVANNFNEAPGGGFGALDGANALKQFGTFAGGSVETNLSQVVSGIAGDALYRLSADAFVWSNDSIAGTSNSDQLQIEFLNASGQVIGGATQTITLVDGASPVNQWIEGVILATSPANAASARVSIIFDQPGFEGGAAYVDDVRLFLVGDANGDGVVDLLDFDTLAQNFGGFGTLGAGDFNEDGVIDLLDFDLLAQNFGAGASAALPGTVPEPASLATLASLTLFSYRRRTSRPQPCLTG
ncbi:MAG: family 16 glycosylhydrolase [Planctomycetota bacterium]